MSGKMRLDPTAAVGAKDQGKTAGDGFAAALMPLAWRGLGATGGDVVSAAVHAALQPVSDASAATLRTVSEKAEGNREGANASIGAVHDTEQDNAESLGK